MIDNAQLRDFAKQRSGVFMNFIKNTFKKSPKPISNQDEIIEKYDAIVFGDEQEKLNYTLSKCCKPIAGDDVFGFITINDGIKVHKKNCPNAISMQSNYAYRIIKAKWIDSSKREFSVILQISGIDNRGIINSLTQIISGSLDTYINSINISGKAGYFDGKISLSVKNNHQLNELINKIKDIEGVQKVSRVNSL
ncbi:MAG: hypothetical protein CR961_01065 [Polaribacter sp.]|nr:MAG: hypothetical protein CR961_01065 [Polaribacter sp.]